MFENIEERELFAMLTKSATKRIREYAVTGDWKTRANAQGTARIEIDDVVNETYLHALKIANRLTVQLEKHLDECSLNECIDRHELPPVQQVIAWASFDAMNALGLRRSLENPTREELAHLANGTDGDGTLPIAPSVSALDVETVHAVIKHAVSRLSDAQGQAIINAIAVGMRSDKDSERGQISDGYQAGLRTLMHAGYSRNNSRATMKRLAGLVSGELDAVRDAVGHRG
jgi:hypothetical protein